VIAAVAAVVAAVAAVVALGVLGSPAPIPPLPSILSAAPGPGFTGVPASPFNGWVSPGQLAALDGGHPLPAGAQMYAVTWQDPSGDGLVEVAVSTPGAKDAAAFTSGLFHSMTVGGGQPFAVPGLSGEAGGVSLPPSPQTLGHPETAALTARSRVSLLFLAVDLDLREAQAVVSRLARTTGASMHLDAGTPGAAPPAYDAPVLYLAGEVAGAALAAALLAAGAAALVRRSRARL
jgi:hypothetical protein